MTNPPNRWLLSHLSGRATHVISCRWSRRMWVNCRGVWSWTCRLTGRRRRVETDGVVVVCCGESSIYSWSLLVIVD